MGAWRARRFGVEMWWWFEAGQSIKEILSEPEGPLHSARSISSCGLQVHCSLDCFHICAGFLFIYSCGMVPSCWR
jgi:hypothetical protein